LPDLVGGLPQRLSSKVHGINNKVATFFQHPASGATVINVAVFTANYLLVRFVFQFVSYQFS
jgi:hypothetical protein